MSLNLEIFASGSDSEYEDDTVNVCVYGMNNELIAQFVNKFSNFFEGDINKYFQINPSSSDQTYTSFRFYHYHYPVQLHFETIPEISFYDLGQKTNNPLESSAEVVNLSIFVYNRVVEGSLNCICELSKSIKSDNPIFVDLSDYNYEDEAALKFCSKHMIKYLSIDDFPKNFHDIIPEHREEMNL